MIANGESDSLAKSDRRVAVFLVVGDDPALDPIGNDAILPGSNGRIERATEGTALDVTASEILLPDPEIHHAVQFPAGRWRGDTGMTVLRFVGRRRVVD